MGNSFCIAIEFIKTKVTGPRGDKKAPRSGIVENYFLMSDVVLRAEGHPFGSKNRNTNTRPLKIAIIPAGMNFRPLKKRMPKKTKRNPTNASAT